MRKNRAISKLSTIAVIISILFSLIAVMSREGDKGKEGWFTVFEEVAINLFKQEILSSQSVIFGVLWEQETSFFYEKKDAVTESAFPFVWEENILSPGKEEVKGMWEENQMVKEDAGEEVKEEMFLTESGKFVPVSEKQQEINWQQYQTTEQLLKGFYTVDSTTVADEEVINLPELKDMDLSINKEGEKPQILLYHTHSQETFIDSRPGEKADSIVGAGELLASLLEEYGYSVLHHKGEYDVKSRDYAYSESLPAITRILKENPQIQVVIDLHRDAVADDVKLITEIQEQQMARVMFFNGLSRSKEQGEISYLKNPYLKENLAFSFQMKAACDEYYPGFARNIYLRAYRYNMHLAPKTLLIELGAQTNTVEEIKNSLYPLAHVLDIVLSGSAQ